MAHYIIRTVWCDKFVAHVHVSTAIKGLVSGRNVHYGLLQNMVKHRLNRRNNVPTYIIIIIIRDIIIRDKL